MVCKVGGANMWGQDGIWLISEYFIAPTYSIKTLPPAQIMFFWSWPWTVVGELWDACKGNARELYVAWRRRVWKTESRFPSSPGAHSSYTLHCPPSWGGVKSNHSQYLLKDAVQSPVCHVSVMELHHVQMQDLWPADGHSELKGPVRKKLSPSLLFSLIMYKWKECAGAPESNTSVWNPSTVRS